MTGTAILQAILEILVGGITTVSTAIGGGLSNLAQSIFLTGTGETQTLSTFGIMIVCFAGIALALNLCKWVVNWVTSFGK